MTVEFLKNVPLASYTSLKIGGPAEYFFAATNREEIRAALDLASKRGMPVTILAGGTNSLIADEGIAGLVIAVRLRGIRVDGTRMVVEAGTPMGEVVAQSVALGLSGLAWAGGLPGTIGGAVFGNAGTFGHAIGEIVESVEYLDAAAELRVLEGGACRFGYRTSLFQDDALHAVIVSVTLRLASGDPKALREEMLRAIAFRNAHHPAPSSAGSFFKNPGGGGTASPRLRRFRELSQWLESPPREWFGRVPAGWLIDRAGMKGFRVGGAMVSEKHANFVVNTGNATAREVRQLAEHVKGRVRDMFGVTLEEEVRYLG